MSKALKKKTKLRQTINSILRLCEETPRRALPEVAIDGATLKLIQAGSPVAVSVSGGKDGAAAAIMVHRFLKRIGHRGPFILIHSDLGSIEWKESLNHCRRLAEFLGARLYVVRRELGGMIEQWEQRWQSSLRRYANLETVALVSPWSSAGSRFCTRSQKIDQISQFLTKLFPGQQIVSVVGLRHEESMGRAKKPISEVDKNLQRANGTSGRTWYPVIEFTVEEIVRVHLDAGFPLHEAYTVYESSRLSCSFCVLSSRADLLASASCADNHDAYRHLVGIEALTGFSFQPKKWLGDLRPELLGEDLRERLEKGKRRAALRLAAEARIPQEMLFSKVWPTFQPLHEWSQLLAEVRVEVAEIIQFPINYRTGLSVHSRYRELLEARERKALKEKRAEERRALRLAGKVKEINVVAEEADHELLVTAA